jgi:putative oxidoreductase
MFYEQDNPGLSGVKERTYMKKLYFQPGLNESRVMFNKGLWALQILLAVMFLMAGGFKLLGAPPVVATFEKIGVGHWFRYLTGLIEVLSAVFLVIPRLTIWGALLIAATMIGATLIHLFVIGGNPLMALIFLLAAAFIAGVRGRT